LGRCHESLAGWQCLREAVDLIDEPRRQLPHWKSTMRIHRRTMETSLEMCITERLLKVSFNCETDGCLESLPFSAVGWGGRGGGPP
jgi:hypothetical protein